MKEGEHGQMYSRKGNMKHYTGTISKDTQFERGIYWIRQNYTLSLQHTRPLLKDYKQENESKDKESRDVVVGRMEEEYETESY